MSADEAVVSERQDRVALTGGRKDRVRPLAVATFQRRHTSADVGDQWPPSTEAINGYLTVAAVMRVAAIRSLCSRSTTN